MCDYSLHLVASRPAKVGDKLAATDFARSITRGFSAVGEPEVAVCLLPGTEIAFDEEVQYDRALASSARLVLSTRLPDSGRSTWTIRTSTMTRWNFPAAKS
jgi:hypothetical protein